jgi:hypothetical protein
MFTVYYILAVGFGAFAVIVSLVGMKDHSDAFPGKFYGPIILAGIVFAIATFAFAWRGGEKEVEHRDHEQSAESARNAASTQLPTGVRATG